MSLGWLRRSTRVVAALLLFVSVLGLPHRSTLDNCLPFGVEEHDESKHVFEPAAGTDHQDHCAVCHWTRWLKPVFSNRAVTVPVGDAGSELTAWTARLPRKPSRAHLSPRAPPAAAPAVARLIQLS